MNEEEKNIKMFKRYINSLEQRLEDYYRIDEEFYKDNIEDLELNIKLARYILSLIFKLQKELEDTRKVEIEVIKENTLFGDKIDEQARLISKLQKELEQEKEKNKKLNLENQALFESINCNDDNMLARRYQKLQKELDKKDKVIDKMAKTISGSVLYDFSKKEYFTLEDEGEVREYFYKKAEEENV